MLKTIISSGAVVNFLLVAIGGGVGTFLKRGIPDKLRKTLTHGMALCVLYIGITGLFSEEKIKPLVVILSVAAGALLGELIDLDKYLNKLGLFLQKKFEKGESESRFAEGFVTATMVFCIGAMTIVGAIDSGIKGNNTVLYSKSLIDMVTALVFASTMGAGVIFSAFPVLIIEGALTILASFVAPVLSVSVIEHIGVVGSLIIIAIGLNLLEITKIKIINLMPAVFFPLALCYIL